MSLATGARIGPYEVLELLGSGGMGEVYRARDCRLDRSVAIKVITSSRSASRTSRERLQREARAIARLSHPYICTLYDVGEQDGSTFLVMELVEGETLAERLQRGPLSVEQTLAIGVQIGEALDAAHRKDIVHRDLKPENLIFAAGGVKLLDFGLAKLREAEYEDSLRVPTKSFQLTAEGAVVGTLPYMAPEQIDGRQTDARTDVFSLGVVLYEMIAGRRPFEGDTRASLMVAILSGEPRSLAEIRPPMPAAVEHVIRRCLAKEPDERWQTARDLAAELRWIAAGGSNAKPTVRTRIRRRRQRVLVSGLALAVATGGAVAGIAMLRPLPTRSEEYHQVTYRRGMVSSARFAPGGMSFVYSASWDGQPYGVFLGRSESPDARDLGLDTGRILSISGTGEMALLFGPQNVEQTFGSRTLTRVPMAGGAQRDVLEGVVDADWIPGTDRFAVIRDPGDGGPWTIEFPAGNTVHQAAAAWSLRVSPDGSRIAFFEGPSHFDPAPEAMITVVDTSGRKSTLSRNWAGLGLAWTPSGAEIWFTATHGGVTDSGSNTRENRSSPPSLQAVSLSGSERTVVSAPDWLVLHDIAADGRLLLSRNTIRIGMACQAPGETFERDLSWLNASFVSDLSPDGRTAIFFDPLSGRSRASNPTLFRRSLDGSPAIPLGEGTAGRLSPDGRWVLASLLGNLVLLPAGAGSTVILPKGSLSQVGAAAWLIDSNRVLFDGVGPDGQHRIYSQQIPNGPPLPISDAGAVMASKAGVRREGTILGMAAGRWLLFPTAQGVPQPVPTLTLRDIPLQWSSDGRFIYTVDRVDGPRSVDFQVFRVEIVTGRRELWKTLAPADPVGVEDHRERTVITPDARSYCYSYLRRLGDLFVVSGLQ